MITRCSISTFCVSDVDEVKFGNPLAIEKKRSSSQNIELRWRGVTTAAAGTGAAKSFLAGCHARHSFWLPRSWDTQKVGRVSGCVRHCWGIEDQLDVFFSWPDSRLPGRTVNPRAHRTGEPGFTVSMTFTFIGSSRSLGGGCTLGIRPVLSGKSRDHVTACF